MKKIKSTQTPRQISTQTISQTKSSSPNHHHNHQQFHLPTKNCKEHYFAVIKTKNGKAYGQGIVTEKKKR